MPRLYLNFLFSSTQLSIYRFQTTPLNPPAEGTMSCYLFLSSLRQGLSLCCVRQTETSFPCSPDLSWKSLFRPGCPDSCICLSNGGIMGTCYLTHSLYPQDPPSPSQAACLVREQTTHRVRGLKKQAERRGKSSFHLKPFDPRVFLLVG